MRKRLNEPNWKGTTCHVDKVTFCQEGYCSNCSIAKEKAIKRLRNISIIDEAKLFLESQKEGARG